MSSTILDFQDVNKVTFSANGTRVNLKTSYGGTGLGFSAEEYHYYLYVFQMADNQNLGKLILNSTQLNSLLIRTNLTWNILNKILTLLEKFKAEYEENGIFFHQWLICCKLMAYAQEFKKVPTNKLIRFLHTNEAIPKAMKIPIVKFHLDEILHEFEGGMYYKCYNVRLVGWQLCGEEFQNQHVKFRLKSQSELHSSIEADIQLKQNNLHERYIVDRRFSEFEAFTNILLKNYKGYVIPPLPLKNWNFINPPPESKILQRSKEFQMFVNDLTFHPALMFTYELKTLLEASQPGFKSFIELYSHLNNGKLEFPNLHQPNVSNIEGVAKIITDSASAVVTNSANTMIAANTKAMGYIASLWSNVTKNITVLNSTTSTTQSNHYHSDGSLMTNNNYHLSNGHVPTDMERTSQFLESITLVGKKMELLISCESNFAQELSKIGLTFNTISEFETIPELNRILSVSNDALQNICKHLQDSITLEQMHIILPVTYLGRYTESYNKILLQKEEVNILYTTAQKEEMEAKKAIEMEQIKPIKNETILNELRLQHVSTEDKLEGCKISHDMIKQRVDEESNRIKFTHKRKLVRSLQSFVKFQIQFNQSSRVIWQEYKDHVDNNSHTTESMKPNNHLKK